MSAVLRAAGHDFDVDRFLAGCRLPVIAVYRRGDAHTATVRLNTRSGLNIAVSDAGFDDFPGQVREATAFPETHLGVIGRLSAYPGVEVVSLDFGIARRSVAVQCEQLPRELVRLAGSAGLGIELSYYSDVGDDAPPS